MFRYHLVESFLNLLVFPAEVSLAVVEVLDVAAGNFKSAKKKKS